MEHISWLRGPFTPGGSADRIAAKFIDYQIRVRVDMEPVQQILHRGEPGDRMPGIAVLHADSKIKFPVLCGNWVRCSE